MGGQTCCVNAEECFQTSLGRTGFQVTAGENELLVKLVGEDFGGFYAAKV